MLEVRALNAWYGKSHILQGVDLDVRAGEIVSLLGRNGVGRSTTVKSIMGQVAVKGAVRFQGEEHRGPQAPRDRSSRPGLRARGPRDLSRPHGAPEPGARPQVGDIAATLRRGARLRALPAAARARRRGGRRAFRRRAADADALPHTDGRSAARDDRRAHRGPGAEDRGAGGGASWSRFAGAGSRSCWWSRSSTSRSTSRSASTCSATAGWCSKARPRSLRARADIRKEWLEV